jgi:4-hydroxybenzoate polyprenyltransferase
MSSLRSVLQRVSYHAYTFWLFTVSDHVPLVYPMTMTGLSNLFSGTTLNAKNVGAPPIHSILLQFPQVIFWVWINFLVFCIGNQRLPISVSEDAINKPWRPVLSGRITCRQATLLWVSLHVVVLLSGHLYFGTTPYTVSLLVLGWLYNDMEGGGYPFSRNLINACAVVMFALGATTVAFSGLPFVLNEKGYQWHWMIGVIVFTTLQVQDLCDQEGDRDRGRHTIPIIFGDQFARWTVVIPILFWSFVAPSFWASPYYVYVGPAGIGGVICWRTLSMKDPVMDRRTYKLWGVWLACLLVLPATVARANVDVLSGI